MLYRFSFVITYVHVNIGYVVKMFLWNKQMSASYINIDSSFNKRTTLTPCMLPIYG